VETNKPKSLIEDINNFLLIKILIFYIIGIIAGHCTGLGIISGISLTALFLLLLAYITKSRRIKTDHSINFLNGLTFAGLWISVGISMTAYHHVDSPSLLELNDGIKYGVIISATEEKPKSYKATIELNNNSHDKLIAYFAKDSLANIPQYGDLIGFVSEIRYISNQGNPLEFNYAKHCQMQGIYCQAYIKNNEYQIIVPEYRNGIKQWGARIRQKLIDIYRNSGITGKELAVLEALTLGYKNDLDDDTISSFQTSGAMHILAVSGLHTGIIMLITNILLSFLNNSLKQRIFKGVIIICTLWAFAAITGFSSSVCRSALMFSLLTLAQMLRRPSSTYNTVAASALILLMIDPLLIFNVGFGLSYLAVLAIISCMPILEKLKPENRNILEMSRASIFWNNILMYFVGIVLVSLAAQIGTGVLSIRTFKLWPVYFLITNIAVIPMSYAIMVSAIAMVAFSFVSTTITGWITAVLRFCLECLTSTVSGIESLPISSIRDIHITNIAAIILYVAIILLVLWLHYRKTIYLKTSLIAVGLFISSNILTTYGRNINSQIIIYNKNNTALYSIQTPESSGMSIYCNADTLDKNTQSLAGNIAALYGITSVKNQNIDSLKSLKDRYFEVNGKSFMLLRGNQQLNVMYNQKFSVDYLIISGNTYITANEVRDVFDAKEVIFDSSNSAWYVDRREKELIDSNIKTHYVSRDGAFVFGDGTAILKWY